MRKPRSLAGTKRPTTEFFNIAADLATLQTRVLQVEAGVVENAKLKGELEALRDEVRLVKHASERANGETEVPLEQ